MSIQSELKERIAVSEDALTFESNHPRLWNEILKNQVAIMKAFQEKESK